MPPVISQSVQDYLKVLYKLQNGRSPGDTINTSQVAEQMDVAAASATNMMKRLAEMKLVDHMPYQGAMLTHLGEKVALEVIRHHRLLELYLAEVLGFKLDEVDAEADRLEHVISEAFEDRIDKVLGFPTTDPHGDPIPTKDGEIDRKQYENLSEVPTGETVVIRQVSDQSPEMLRYMGSMGLRPEVELELKERAPFNGPLQIRVQGKEYSLGIEVARHIYVTVAP